MSLRVKEEQKVANSAKRSGDVSQASAHLANRCLNVLFTRVVFLLILSLLLTSCDDDENTELSFSKVSYWSMPPKEKVYIPEPRSITIGPNDEVIVLDKMARVIIYNPDGSVKDIWDMPNSDDGNPQHACITRDGLVAVADTHYFRVVIFNWEGEVVKTFGEYGKGDGQFFYVGGIACDDQGNFFVGEWGDNDRIQKFTPQGDHLLTFGSIGSQPGQFRRLAGMTWFKGDDGRGRIAVADAENGRIQIFLEDGTFERVFSPPNGQNSEPYRFDFPYDVAVDSQGSFYVIEYGGNRLLKFAKDGRPLGYFGGPGRGEKQFRTPWSVGVDQQGRVRIADTANRRVVALNP